jgi:peptidoglycan/LPS O-acetylase OafA/YrhL
VLDQSAAVAEGAADPTRPARRPGLAHVPALDGLRGSAVAAVLLFHAGYLTGGWLGVDLFFVLSGYLITSLLLFEHRDNGRIDLPAFWGRRARRLLPALVLVLVAVAIYAKVEVAPIDLGRVRTDGIAALFFSANWHEIWTGTSYWDRTLAPSLLAHTWSLAVEEQLYLLWPLLLTVVFSRRRRRSPDAVAQVALAVAAASAAAALVLHAMGASNERIYFGTDTRAVAVALGAFVAGWRRRKGGVSDDAARTLELGAIVAAVALAAMWWRLDGSASITYSGGLLLASALGAVVVAAASDARSTRLAAALSLAPLRWLGLISYGLYLWHWPIYAALSPRHTGMHGPVLLALRLAVTLAAACASWFLVERPIRTKQPSGWWVGTRGTVSGLAAAAIVVVALVAATTGAVHYSTKDLATGIVRSDGAGSGAPKVLVVGDSVSASLASPAVKDPKAFGLDVIRSSVNGCQAVWDGVHRARGTEGNVNTPDACPPDLRQLVTTEKPAAVVVDYGGWTDADFELDGSWRDACSPAYQAALHTRFAAVLADVHSSGAPVVVMGAARSTNTFREDDNWKHTLCTNEVMKQEAAKVEGVKYLDLDAWLCPGGHCREREDGVYLRSDGVHFQGPGGVVISHWVFDQVAKLTGLQVTKAGAAPKDPYLTRVCHSFVLLQDVSDPKRNDGLKAPNVVPDVKAALDGFGADTVSHLAPDAAKDIGPMGTPGVRSDLLSLIARAQRGEKVTGNDLGASTSAIIATGFARLRQIC